LGGTGRLIAVFLAWLLGRCYTPNVINLEALKIRHRIQLRLLRLNQALDLRLLENPNMAVSTGVAALITEFDTATDAIAARIQKLIDTSTTLSADDTAALQAEVNKLNLLGQDPNNPVPAALKQA
jgi:hypothetical protein